MVGKAFIRTILSVVAIMMVALTAGCAQSKEVRVGSDSSGQKIAMKPDQRLAVRLESNPTTGYGWEVAEYDASVLSPEGEAVYEQEKLNEKLTGAGGWQTFKFKPVKTGETRLKLVYRRSWEKDVEPIQIYEVQVVVE